MRRHRRRLSARACRVAREGDGWASCRQLKTQRASSAQVRRSMLMACEIPYLARPGCVWVGRAAFAVDNGSHAESGSSSRGAPAVALEDLDRVPADVGDVDRRLAWPDV